MLILKIAIAVVRKNIKKSLTNMVIKSRIVTNILVPFLLFCKARNKDGLIWVKHRFYQVIKGVVNWKKKTSL